MCRIFQLVALGAMLAMAATAGNVVLTFEGLQNAEEVQGYYNGGYGNLGSGPGPNYGVTFTDNGWAYISADDGGTAGFAGNPSGDTAFTFRNDGNPGIMDVSGGFSGGFSFYYSAVYGTGTINIYSGLDGAGTLLDSFTPAVTSSEPNTPPTCPNSDDIFCPFYLYQVTFSGTAYSVDFTGTEGEVAFDDITLDNATPNGVPEPAAFSLLGLGLAALLLISRRPHKLQRAHFRDPIRSQQVAPLHPRPDSATARSI
ncbi:MAG: hypothetical protein WBL61_13005 [Bryobacteraceae bacterium]